MRRLAPRLMLAGTLAAGLALAEAPAPVQLSVHPSATRATVGDRIVIQVEVKHPPGVTFDPPTPVPGEGTALSLEPMKLSAADAPSSKDNFYFQAQAFETGAVQIPAFQTHWKNAAGESGTATSEPLRVEIVSVLKGEQEKPADLKPPAEIPAPPFPWLWVLLGAVGLALLAALAYRLLRRRRPAAVAPPAPVVPAVPAHEQAYRELERLLAGPLLREGKVKQFHVELTEIIKRYLASRFALAALERTSYEVLEDLKRVRIGSEPVAVAREFLGETDLVKFARYHPAEDEIRRNVDRAYRLVDSTKLVAMPPPAEGGPAPGGLAEESAG